MCIAIYKPMGKSFPKSKTFETCFNNNPDGAGYMYSFDGKVHIEKGFMTIEDFNNSLTKTIKSVGGKNKAKALPFVFHFRITTQGGVKKELTHPFSFTDNYDDMKKLSNVCDMAVAHNGIISATSSYVNDHNDTMEFIKEIAYPLITKSNNFEKDSELIKILTYFLHGNRVVFLNGKGNATLIGDWIEDKGMYFSNTSYKTEKISYKSSKYFKCIDDYYDDYYSRKYENYKPSNDESLTKEQINELNTFGYCYCDYCGDDMYFYYDDEYKSYIGVCQGCGQVYLIPNKEVDHLKRLGLIYEKEMIYPELYSK